MATKTLKAQILIGGAISSSFRTMIGGVKGSLGELGKTISTLERGQRNLGRSIQTLGRQGRSVDTLRNSYSRLTEQLERTRRAQTRLQEAARFRQMTQAVSGKLHTAAATAGIASGAIFAGLAPGIKEAKRDDTERAKIESLGFSKKDADQLIGFAKAQKAFGVSTVEATETARDLASAFGDTHHAIQALPLALKQRSALALYDSQHDTNLAEGAAYAMGKVIELRNGTKDQQEYNKQANMAHQVMVATGGRVTGQEMQNALRTGGIAAKAMSDEAFYYGGSHFMQEMGGDTFGTASMSLYQALAQGRTTRRAARNLEAFGLIGDSSKVTHDKTGQLTFMNPGAIKGYETFVSDPQKWVNETFIPALRAQGIDPDDMTKAAEIAGMIVSNRTGANLLATRVAQRAVVEKETGNAARADDIAMGNDRAKDSATGREKNVEARLSDVKLRLGESLMPTYVSALEKIAGFLESVTKFAAAHPTAFKGMAMGVAGLGVALGAAVPVLLTASAVLNTLSLMRLARANMEVAALNGNLSRVGPAAAGASAGIMGFAAKLGVVAALSQAAFQVLGKLGLPTPEEIAAQGNGVGAEQIRKGQFWKASANLPALDYAKAAYWHLSGQSNDTIADKLTGKHRAVTGKYDRKAPTSQRAIDSMSRNDWKSPELAQYGAPSQIHITNNITQQPGESQEALARKVMDQIKRNEQVRNRGSLADH
ncbi:MAG: hypothetical protein GAK31_00931 [Stenotrophomonas maltophilia]|uniref:Phage tail tape measure protein n=1 Tax=Stenotrophomonas maltophilia TaxID=40324 RepID=A0A7V8FKD2_STEMA|nr:MAG: hypothetical protein GAK31_00931 [Stenotrophomonas maltophilia]